MQESAKIFWQTSPDIYSIDNIPPSSFFHTLISLTIIVSHHYFPIQIVKFFLKFMNMFGKINLFCISIYIMKHLNQKTQNNWFLTQIIVPWVLKHFSVFEHTTFNLFINGGWHSQPFQSRYTYYLPTSKAEIKGFFIIILFTP